MGGVSLCTKCTNRSQTAEGPRCAIGASGAALLEARQPVTRCEGFKDQGGRVQITDNDGRVRR